MVDSIKTFAFYKTFSSLKGNSKQRNTDNIIDKEFRRNDIPNWRNSFEFKFSCTFNEFNENNNSLKQHSNKFDKDIKNKDDFII